MKELGRGLMLLGMAVVAVGLGYGISNDDLTVEVLAVAAGWLLFAVGKRMAAETEG